MRSAGLLGTALLGSVLAIGCASQVSAAELRPRAPFGKGRLLWTEQLPDHLMVKFAEGSGVRLRGGQFVSTTGADLGRVRELLARHPGHDIERQFGDDEARLSVWHRAAQTARGEEIADPNLFFLIHLRDGRSRILSEALETLPVVELAHPLHPIAPPPACTAPSYQSSQGYLGPAPGGIDAYFAWTYPGGNGTGFKVVDCEGGWNDQHEDLSKIRGALYGATPYPYNFTYNEHGTAVMGEMIGDDNACGVKGAAYGAAGAMSVIYNAGGFINVPRGIAYACSITQPGDVILLEVQIFGPSCSGNTVIPCEWDPATYTAITIAVGVGRNVVEAAGNGGISLDCPSVYTVNGVPWFSVYHDSGAIMVGAGASPISTGGYGTTVDRGVLNFSNYGSRVDVQGWGETVTTCGYGDLFGTGINTYYTSTFSGTSSASPIVSAAVLDLEGAYRGATGSILTPAQVRQLLISTGSPQMFGTGAPSSKHIGPRPDLKAAILSLALTPGVSYTPTSTPTTTSTGSFSPSMTASYTRCATGSMTSTRTATSTGSFSPSLTLTLSFTPTRTPTPCSSLGYSCTETRTRTFTRTFTISNTFTISHTATPTRTSTTTRTWTPTATATPVPAFSVWPNPAAAGQPVQFDGLGPGVVQLEIYSISGERIAKFETEDGSLAWNPWTGDGVFFAAGPYVCRVRRFDGWHTATFVLGRTLR